MQDIYKKRRILRCWLALVSFSLGLFTGRWCCHPHLPFPLFTGRWCLPRPFIQFLRPGPPRVTYEPCLCLPGLYGSRKRRLLQAGRSRCCRSRIALHATICTQSTVRRSQDHMQDITHPYRSDTLISITPVNGPLWSLLVYTLNPYTRNLYKP